MTRPCPWGTFAASFLAKPPLAVAFLLAFFHLSPAASLKHSRDGPAVGYAGSGPFYSLDLSHRFSQLPGSSYGGLGQMSWEHHRRVRAHDTARHLYITRRRLAGAATGGAQLLLSGSANPQEGGLYWTELGLGTPQRNFKLQIDTGSDVTWVDCTGPSGRCLSCPTSGVAAPFSLSASSTSTAISCKSSECDSFQSADSSRRWQGCDQANSGDPSCYYELQYGDGSTSIGLFFQDRLHYSLLGGSQGSIPLTLGCGFNQSGGLVSSGELVDGILGLGMGALSLPTQLNELGAADDVLGHCLAGESGGGGTLIIGDIVTQGLVFTPLIAGGSQYYATLQGISVSGTLVSGITADSFGSPGLGGGVIFDTGTTLALFPADVYSAWIGQVAPLVSGLQQLGNTQFSDQVCFDYSGRNTANLDQHFPRVVLHFDGADMPLNASNYVNILSAPSGAKAACIEWQPVGSSGEVVTTVLGDLILKDQLVVYDRPSSQIGWMPMNCQTGTIRATMGGGSSGANVSIIIGSTPSSALPRHVMELSAVSKWLLLPTLVALSSLALSF